MADRLVNNQLVDHNLRQLTYAKKTKIDLHMQLSALKGSKNRGFLTPESFVRVGLADPSLNGRQLSDFLSTGGFGSVSHGYVDFIRDAFAELLKNCQDEALSIQKNCVSM